MVSTVTSLPRSDALQAVFTRSTFQHYQIKYRGAVGQVQWRWAVGSAVITLSLESFPTKLDYKSDFIAIRRELERHAPSLTASVYGTAAAGFASSRDNSQKADVEWLHQVQQHYGDLDRALDRLLGALRSQIRPDTRVITRERMRRLRPLNRRAYVARPTAAVEVASFSDSEASAINGHLKWEMQRLRGTVVAARNAPWFEKLDQNLQNPVNLLEAKLESWLRRVRHIPAVVRLPNLHVRLRDPLYESAFRSLNALRAALLPLESAYPVGLKDLPTLYEYWVFVKIIEILRVRYPVTVRDSMSFVQRAGADLVLTPGRASEVVLENSSGLRVACQFNRRFGRLPTTNQRPDAVIEIRGGSRLLVIDAKYRLGRDPEYLRRYGSEGPLPDDINVIHRYRDAIVNPVAPFARLSRAGLIAFPGKTNVRYQSHQFYRSWLAVRVGGMPMLPSSSDLMEQAIYQYLDEVEMEIAG